MTWTFNASVPFAHTRFTLDTDMDVDRRRRVIEATERWLDELHDIVDPERRRLGRPSETSLVQFAGTVRRDGPLVRRYGVDPAPEKYDGYWYREQVRGSDLAVVTVEIRDLWENGRLVQCEHLGPDGWVPHREGGDMRHVTRVEWK